MTTVYYTIAVNVIVLTCCLLFFSIYRLYDDKIFAPKADLMPDRTPPKIPNKTMFGWIFDLHAIDDNVLIDKGGYDILFFIRFYRLSFKIFFCFAIYAWGILLPINGTGEADSDDNSFELWSMTNIKQGSSRCWYHLIGIYILTGITIYFLEKEFAVYAKHRHIYLRQRRAHLRTVLVEGIPHKMRSTVTLATYFETMYPNAVLSVRLGQDLRHLDRLVEQREQATSKLERSLYASHNGLTRPTIHLPNMLEAVDAIRYYTQVLDDLNDAVAKEQEKAKRLAMYADRLSGSMALNVIEGFLHVTEIGSLKRLLRGRNSTGDKWILRNKPRSTYNSISNEKLDLGDGGQGEGNDIERLGLKGIPISEDCEDGQAAYRGGSKDESNPLLGNGVHRKMHNVAKPFKVYKMSWSEWLWALWSAPSLSDCWRRLKEGRNAEDHAISNDDDEDAGLISTPEERRMFLSKAFVTFKTFTAATTARQVVHMQLAGHMAVSEAPEPTDMTWANLYSTRTGTMLRRFVVESFVMLLIIVWVAPVTLISFIVSEDALRGYSPLIDKWCNQSNLFLSAVELVQPGALVAIMNCLPPVLVGRLRQTPAAPSELQTHTRFSEPPLSRH